MSPTCLPSHQLFHIPSPSPSATPQPRSSSHYTLFPQYALFPPPRILCQSFRSQLKCGTCLAKTSQCNKAPAPCAHPVLFHTLFSCPFLLFPNLQCSGLFAALFVGHELLPDSNGSLAHLHPSWWPCTQPHTGHTTGPHVHGVYEDMAAGSVPALPLPREAPTQTLLSCWVLSCRSTAQPPPTQMRGGTRHLPSPPKPRSLAFLLLGTTPPPPLSKPVLTVLLPTCCSTQPTMPRPQASSSHLSKSCPPFET